MCDIGTWSYGKKCNLFRMPIYIFHKKINCILILSFLSEAIVWAKPPKPSSPNALTVSGCFWSNATADPRYNGISSLPHKDRIFNPFLVVVSNAPFPVTLHTAFKSNFPEYNASIIASASSEPGSQSIIIFPFPPYIFPPFISSTSSRVGIDVCAPFLVTAMEEAFCPNSIASFQFLF